MALVPASRPKWDRRRALRGNTRDTAPADATAWTTSVTGWHEETFNKDIVPRVYDVILDGTSRAIVRLDRVAPGSSAFVGRFKIDGIAAGQYDERTEEDVAITSWDGRNLTFSHLASPACEVFTGVVSGRAISGSFAPAGDASRIRGAESASRFSRMASRRAARPSRNSGRSERVPSWPS